MNKLLYVLTGVVAFLVFIIIFAPASLVLNFTDDITLPELDGLTVNGSIWQGTGNLSFHRLPPTSVDWSLSALGALGGVAQMDMAIKATGLTGNLAGEFAEDGGTISEANFDVQSSYLNQVTVPEGLDLSGTFTLTDGLLDFDRAWINDASGQLDWTGGLVHIRTPTGFYSADLPPLMAEINMDGEDLVVPVADRQTGEILVDIRITRDGWAKIGVNHTFVALSGLPLPAGSDNTNPAILIEQQIR